MKTIYKYDISNSIDMPMGAEILCLKIQFDEPKIWALVDPSKPMEEREFRVVGTGHDLPDSFSHGNYIDTFLEGAFVWHLFEIK